MKCTLKRNIICHHSNLDWRHTYRGRGCTRSWVQIPSAPLCLFPAFFLFVLDKRFLGICVCSNWNHWSEPIAKGCKTKFVRKHPVSIALSNRILQKIGREALKQKRSRSEYIELHFETLLFKSLETEKENAVILTKRQRTS
jgi:hypothetical protein